MLVFRRIRDEDDARKNYKKEVVEVGSKVEKRWISTTTPVRNIHVLL